MLGPRILGVVSSILALSGLGQAVPHAARADWPNGPFVTSGRNIHDASGTNVTYAGVNWPGHADVMIPEGLQYQSIETIVTKIKSTGMNSIRLTYAIEMIDQIYANNDKDIQIDTALTKALGATNGPKVLAKIIANNPQFNASTTRLQVRSLMRVLNGRDELNLIVCRSSMPLLRNARNSKSISTWITTSLRACGAAQPMMGMLGGETKTSTPITGSEVCRIWPTM